MSLSKKQDWITNTMLSDTGANSDLKRAGAAPQQFPWPVLALFTVASF